MSKLSGKCDLYDHLCMEKMYDKGSYLVSDIYECFTIFKKRTNGTIYQHHNLKVNEDTQELIKKYDGSNFSYEKIIDEPTKYGRERYHYVYTYWNKTYSEKELNKKDGVWIEYPIHFDSLIDLIPYLSYIVCMSGSDDKGEHIVIGKKSYVEEEFEKQLQRGHEFSMYAYYKKEQSNLYLNVINNYYNERDMKVIIEELEFDENGINKTSTSHRIDDRFDVNFFWKDGQVKSHWTSPKIIDAEKGLIQISKEDLNTYIGNKAFIRYTAYKEPKKLL